MKVKRFLAMVIALVMCITSLAACGGGNSGGGDKASSGGKDTTATQGNDGGTQAAGTEGTASGDVETIVFAMMASKNAPEGIQMVEDEINKITESKIGVHVKIEPIGMANYAQQIGLMMSGGEQIDIVTMLGTYSQMLAKNQLKALSALLDEYGQGTKEALGPDFLKSTTSKGEVYALPCINGKAAVMNIVLRKDLVDELGLNVDDLKIAETTDEYFENMDVLTEWFAKIHEAHPEMVCLVPTGQNQMMFNIQLPFMDYMNDYYGVLTQESSKDMTIEDFYSTDEFKRGCEYAHDWYQKGYILQDASTTTEAPNTYVQSGRTAGYFVTGEEGQAEQITTATGVEVIAVKLVKPYLTTTSVNGISFGISSTSEHGEAAMKFLNEMYTNADIVNLLDWGIEGVHYEVQEDGTVDFPEGVTAENTTYGLNQDWMFGNQFLSKVWGKGRDITIYERLEANNKSAQFSPANGFSYDSTAVRSQITALENVRAQYLPGLSTGTLDPEKEIPNFVAALESAGLKDVITEKQNQLNTWMAENNIEPGK